MEDIQVGQAIRAVRIRRGWRQADLATASKVCRETVSRMERGHIGSYSLDLLRAVAAALEIRVSLSPRWRAGDLDRMLAVRHSRLHESVVRELARSDLRWVAASEVSFNVWGERGVIDILLWHPTARAVVVVELKTELVDVNELLGTMDRRRRLAAQVARDRGWEATSISAWIVLAASRTNERRVAEHRSMLRAAYPAGGRTMKAWLEAPHGSISALSMWRDRPSEGPRLAPTRRVRVAPPDVGGGPMAPPDVGGGPP